MNYHSDEWIESKLQEHYEDSQEYFNRNNIVGIFVQGSQNYGLDYEGSDLDTKLIITPKLDDLIFNKQPVSTTHIRENEEHIDFKDIRLYFQTFVKQNLNFLEILFTDYSIINGLYANDWLDLIRNRELIARMNPYTAVKSMKGIAHNKMAALKRNYPCQTEVVERLGYSPKQLHHIKRVEDCLERYIAGESYIACLKPKDPEYLMMLKKGLFNEADATSIAEKAMEHIDKIADEFCEKTKPEVNQEAVELLNSVQTSIVKKSLVKELENEA